MGDARADAAPERWGRVGTVEPDKQDRRRLMAYVEDFDEDLDDAEDIEDALGEDEFSERRRRRRKARGRGYARIRGERGAASQSDLQVAASRIGQDIRTLNSNVGSVETRLDRFKREQAQSMQMMALLPLLIRPKSIATNAAVANLPVGTKVLVEDGDTLSSLLPLLLIGGMGGMSYSASGGSAPGGMGGMDPMMLVVLLIALDRKGGTTA
jgi:hypothetical protein